MAYTKPIDIDYNKIYQSNSCGPFRIIQNLGRDKKSRLYVRIKFIDTGTEKDVRYDLACRGSINDDLYGIDFNKIYYSTYSGPYKIIEFAGRPHEGSDGSRKQAKIRFLNTGHETVVQLRQAQSGQVSDKTLKKEDRKFPTNISREEHDKLIDAILRDRWRAMMERCYNSNNSSYYKYGAIGVKVDSFWHYVENYLLSVRQIRGFVKFYNDPLHYNLDKDYKQLNIPREKRVYSPYTCIWLHEYDNANLYYMENHDPKELYGVKRLSTKKEQYLVQFSINGERKEFGVYSNILAAASVYEFYYFYYHPFDMIPLINKNLQTMSLDEAMKYKIR